MSLMLRLHTKRLGYPNLFVCKELDDRLNIQLIFIITKLKIQSNCF